MHTIDLIHPISSQLPIYPGTNPSHTRDEYTIENNGFQEKKIIFYDHSGTHVDTPIDIIQNAKPPDRFPISNFCGSGTVFKSEAKKYVIITFSDLEPHLQSIDQMEFLLTQTEWSHLGP
jgi:kynurenine formamidase